MPQHGIGRAPTDWAYLSGHSEPIDVFDDLDSLFDPEELQGWTLSEIAMIFAEDDPTSPEGEPSPEDTALRLRLHNRIRESLTKATSRSDSNGSEGHASEERACSDKE